MIRYLAAEDIPEVMHMCVAMHAESPEYRDNHFSHDKMEDLLDRCVEYPQLLCLLSVQGDEITGMFIGSLSEFFFGDDLITSDLLCYVKPEYRGSRDGYQLLKGYMEWSAEIGANVTKLGITTGITEEKTAKLYKKLGFEYSGSVYKLRK